MRTYSKRERVLAAITVPIWLAVVVIFVGVVATVPDARTNVLWLGGLGGVGATFIAVKIVVTGRSLRRLEQDAFDALAERPLPPDQ